MPAHIRLRQVAYRGDEQESLMNIRRAFVLPFLASVVAFAPAASAQELGVQFKKKKRKNKNTPCYDVRAYLLQIHGVDVLEIFGISEISALEILAETGTDLSKWPTGNHFVSWFNFCPNNKITGGKLISSMIMKKTPNIAAQAFRAAANGLSRSDNWLGDYFRRMRAKGGHKYAIVATARKLALIYYRMVRYKEVFKEVDMEAYKEKQRQAKIGYLEKRLAKLRGEAEQVVAA